jgi:spermidine synthase
LIQPLLYKWFLESTTSVEGHMHAIVRTIVGAKTKYQTVEIMELASYGKALVLDGRIQSSQADEFVYHEALVHPGLLAAPAPPVTALVIGGGEGATVREILRYPSIRRVVMVDIDGEVVELCKRHLPEMHQGAFDDPRTEVRIEDARAYLAATRDTFDYVCIDLVEPLDEGPACLLFTREFYGLVRDRLSASGTMTMQAGMTKIGEINFFSAVHRTLREVFPVVRAYQAFISCFGTPWGFMVAAKAGDPRTIAPEAVDQRLRDGVTGELVFYDGQAHRHLFSLPKHLSTALGRPGRVVTDAEPLLVK